MNYNMINMDDIHKKILSEKHGDLINWEAKLRLSIEIYLERNHICFKRI